jgi:hypothetical protein
MDIGKMQRFFLTATMACFTFLLSYAQPSLKTTVDKNEILIGDQFKLKIEIKDIAEGYKITLPVIPDSLSHFEVVNRDKIDSSYQDKKLSGISQTITLTSFDSGKWVLPSFLVNVDPLKDDTTYNFFTDSVPVTVSFSLSDTTRVIRDIKPIREADTVNVIWYWIGAGVLLAALIIFLIWFYKYWRKNKIDVPFKSKVSPYDEAMKELDKLKALNISSPEEIRVAHIKLGEILKRYLTRKQNTSYLNKTTSEILISLSEQAVDKEMLAKVASSLRCSDAVKFAKYLPPTNETAESMVSIKEVISQIHKQTTIDKPQKPNLKP